MGFVYSTNRVVQIPSKFLSIIYYIIVFGVLFYIVGYGIIWSKGYQTTSPIESVVVTKVKGVLKTTFQDRELAIPNPEFYRRVWDASDIVSAEVGSESGGFFVLTNVVITPNQTRGICPESQLIDGATCKIDKDCRIGKSLKLGNGVMTGKCITSDKNMNVRTCEIDAWCPVEQNRPPLNGNKALLLDTQDFTVLVKNSIEFPAFGFKRRNILDSAGKKDLQDCIYSKKADPYCPTFRIGDIVAGAGDNYSTVALTGGVFSLQIDWFCSFDWGASIKDCLPKYSFARLDNPHAINSPGFNFRTAVYHEENRRTLKQNFGLKFIIRVEGEGRRFEPIKFVLAIGASVGLFAVASFICDLILIFFYKLKSRLKWKYLSYYNEEMKFDLTHVKVKGNAKHGSKDSNKTREQETLEL